MQPSTAHAVSALTPAQLAPATGVLARAFERYPLLRYAFAEQLPRYDELVAIMFRLTLSRRLSYEGLVLGVAHGAGLAGVAAVTLPDHGAMPEADRLEAEGFDEAMGAAARERFAAYGAIVERHQPAGPHLYLGVLGVEPLRHGLGYGRALLDAVHALAEEHPTAEGVYLDTEHAANVELYRRFGYEVVGEGRAGPVPVWCLYRPKRCRAAGEGALRLIRL